MASGEAVRCGRGAGGGKRHRAVGVRAGRASERQGHGRAPNRWRRLRSSETRWIGTAARRRATEDARGGEGGTVRRHSERQEGGQGNFRRREGQAALRGAGRWCLLHDCAVLEEAELRGLQWRVGTAVVTGRGEHTARQGRDGVGRGRTGCTARGGAGRGWAGAVVRVGGDGEQRWPGGGRWGAGRAAEVRGEGSLGRAARSAGAAENVSTGRRFADEGGEGRVVEARDAGDGGWGGGSGARGQR